MPTHRTWKRNAIAATGLACLCAAAGIWLHSSDSAGGRALANASYDSYYSWFDVGGRPPSNAPVVVVYLDNESHEDLKADPARPLPRSLHARLVSRLTRARARAVLFDVVFDALSQSDEDQAFASSMRTNGSVVLAGEIKVSSGRTGDGPWGRISQMSEPIKILQEAAAGWGLSEVAVDEDFISRRHFAGSSDGREDRPSLTVMAARLVNPSEAIPGSYRDSGRWLRYYGPPFSIPHVRFSQALDDGAVSDDVFRDRIVLVGARPMAGLFAERRDELRSPFHPSRDRDRDVFMPGVEVHATQMLNLLRKDWLTRPAKTAELWWLAGAGVMAGAGLILLRPVAATLGAVVGATAVAITAVMVLRETGKWVPWLIPVAVQIPMGLGGSILFHSIDWYRERRRLEAARRAADARIREQAALIDKATDAILVQDLDGHFTHANPAAEQLFGWSEGELQNGVAVGLLEDETAREARRKASLSGESRAELTQRTRTGKQVLVESRWTLLRDEAGLPSGILIINSDVTEKKQLEAESLRMQRMDALGALAGGMAHDLNNALAPVLMGTQLLKRDATDDRTRRILDHMEAGTRRGADMVRQVLMFTRGSSSGPRPVDVRPILKELEHLIRDTFPRSLQICSQVAGDVWPVSGDATQLHQVLLNLCVNARDAMPQGGILTLAVDNAALSASDVVEIPGSHAGEFVVLMVSDTGGGIPSDVLSRIFEPFFTTKSEGQGTGLGLSTCARIVKAHGGFVNVQTTPGEGSTFEVYLPRLENPTDGLALSRQSTTPRRGHGEHILVADDDHTVRDLLRQSLEEHGYCVVTATHGGEVISRLKAMPQIALILCAPSLQVMSGIVLMRAVREMRPDLPWVWLGGEEIRDEKMDVLELNIPALPKPVDLDTLLQTVSQQLPH